MFLELDQAAEWSLSSNTNIRLYSSQTFITKKKEPQLHFLTSEMIMGIIMFIYNTLRHTKLSKIIIEMAEAIALLI